STIGAAAGAPETDDAFGECLALPDFRRQGPQHLAHAAYDLTQFVRQRRIDLLHVHTPIAIAMARVVGKLTGVPVIAVVHGSFVGTGGVAESAFRGVERLTGRWVQSTVVLNQTDEVFYRSIVKVDDVALAPGGGCGVPVERLRRALHDTPLVNGPPVVGYV